MPRHLRTAFARPAAALVAAGCAAALVSGCGGQGRTDGSPAPAQAIRTVPVAATTAITSSHPAAQRTGRVRAFGDSVMLGASYALRHRLHAKVNADESRQAGTLLSLVRKANARGKLTGPVVIHTGTNGAIVRADLERTLGLLRHERVVLVTVKASRSWTADNNTILRKVDLEYGNVVVADWHKKAGRHSAWTYSDGIHLTPSGRTAYAKLVGKALSR